VEAAVAFTVAAAAVAERFSVRRGVAAGAVAHNNQTAEAERCRLQRAAGQQWKRLSHLLWQWRQWQLWQLHTTIELHPDAVASAVASAAVAERCSVRRGSGSGGRMLQRAAGQRQRRQVWQRRQWQNAAACGGAAALAAVDTTIKMGRCRKLQSAMLNYAEDEQRRRRTTTTTNNDDGEQRRRQTTTTNNDGDVEQ
jgi:hypothetical protein